ncbi:MAG: hypothetical protein V4637_12335 [Pseudomonadota bacterium]
MSQQINLLTPLDLAPRRSGSSARVLLIGVAIVIALSGSLAAYEQMRLRASLAESQSSGQALKQARAAHERLTAAQAVKPDPSRETELISLAAQVKSRQAVIDALQSGVIGAGTGFSEYMRAFSRQRIEGVWLTGFDISEGGRNLALTGRALSGELIPRYLEGLNRESLLRGRQFASMLIHHSSAPTEAAPSALPPVKDSARTNAPRSFEFRVSSQAEGAPR